MEAHDCFEAVGNNQARHASQSSPYSLLDEAVTVAIGQLANVLVNIATCGHTPVCDGVNVCGRFVHHKDARLAQQRPGQAQQLALTDAQVLAVEGHLQTYKYSLI